MGRVVPIGFSVLMWISASAYAAPIYTWTGDDGVKHYSSKPLTKDAKVADLPPIMRADVKVSQQKLVTCDSHGGVNCAAGTDTDGSVICYDGFREASNRFRFTCTSPKLEITDIANATKDGSFMVFVRNSKSVPADKPALSFSPHEGGAVLLDGPELIDPFGIAEFTFIPKPGQEVLDTPEMAQLSVTCANCLN